MALPDTFPGLALEGYIHQGQSLCRGCNATIEWFRTPKNQMIPMSLKTEVRVGTESLYSVPSFTKLEPHFAACPNAERFKRKRT
jgi:hypothetical protein